MNKQPSDLEESLCKFEKENPEVVEAMRLFNMSWEQYQAALRALQPTRVYTTASTHLPQQHG
jgi:hypothetical protein